MGLLAYGRIARRVARIAAGVGMEVIVCDPYLDPEALQTDDPARPEVVDFDELLSRSDVLSLHAPLTDETRHIMDRAAFERCRDGVLFVNAARGGLVDHDALVEALDSGKVAAAGLDVTEPEPLDQANTLLHRDNVVVTPHIASSTVVGRDRMLAMAIEQALQALSGQRPTNLVNVDAWRAGQ
jgi:D-3-phosphoglycerate dehydrogenase